MSTVNPLIFNANVLGLLKEWSPADLEVDAVNLKAITTHTSKLINVAGFKHFIVAFKQVIVGTTPTLGAGGLKAQIFFEDGTTALFAAKDLATLLDIQEAAGTYMTTVQWSRDIAGNDLVVSNTGTVPTVANIDFFRPASYIKLILDITAASNAGTSHVGSLYLRAHT